MPPERGSCCRRAAPAATPAGRGAADPPQDRQAVALQRMARPHDRHRHRGHRGAPAMTAPPCPAAWPTARTTRPVSVSSRPDSASRRSTGLPSAMLAAISRQLPLARRARQHPGGHRMARRDEIQPNHGLAGEHVPPEPECGSISEILAPQPQLMPDQQLDSRLQTQQARRPHPQTSDQVLEAGSKSGPRSARSTTTGYSLRWVGGSRIGGCSNCCVSGCRQE